MSFALKPVLLALALAIAATLPALAHSYKLGAIEIGHPWTEPVTGSSTVVTLALANGGAGDDALVGAATPIGAARLEAPDDATVPRIPLMPHRPLALRRGHPHIAIDRIMRPLAAGEAFPLTLEFAKAGKITVSVMVEALPSD